jgi:hypothetical protein
LPILIVEIREIGAGKDDAVLGDIDETGGCRVSDQGLAMKR